MCRVWSWQGSVLKVTRRMSYDWPHSHIHNTRQTLADAVVQLARVLYGRARPLQPAEGAEAMRPPQVSLAVVKAAAEAALTGAVHLPKLSLQLWLFSPLRAARDPWARLAAVRINLRLERKREKKSL